MPPEVINGQAPDGRGDVFSLGLVIRHALTGTEVFPDLDGLQLLQALATRPVDLPLGIASAFRTLLRRMVHVDPEQRVRTALEVLRELDLIERKPEARGPTSRRAAGDTSGSPARRT